MTGTKPDRLRMVAALKAQQRAMHRDSENEFDFYLDTAKQLMPNRAEEPLFDFIVRRLWQPHDGCAPANWLEVLPDRYADFRQHHSWLSCGSAVTGSPAGGIQSLAKLLCALRRRQRDLEGK